ncbi:hypothetical protein ACFV19_22730 [Streptomyces griseoluteus]|uniref:hypothetical protein n=1 Tax=Streptomyces griseoluteus TaxID=29306 RepID=UPI0036A38687
MSTRPRHWAEPILAFIQANGSSGATAATVAVLTGCSTPQARARLNDLVRRGRLVQDDDRYLPAPTREIPGGVEHARA